MRISNYIPHSVKEHPLYYTLLVVVCIAGCIVLVIQWASPTSPLDDLNIAPPTMLHREAASPDDDETGDLPGTTDYAQALAQAEAALRQSDMSINELCGIAASWADEDLLDDEEAEMTKNSELRWTYIYLLVRMDRHAEARKQLKRYLKNEQYCEHLDEAKALLHALR